MVSARKLGALALAVVVSSSSRRTRPRRTSRSRSRPRAARSRSTGSRCGSSRSRRPRPRCSTRSAPGSRSSRSTTSRTTRRARRARSSPGSRRTWRRSAKYKPDLVPRGRRLEARGLVPRRRDPAARRAVGTVARGRVRADQQLGKATGHRSAAAARGADEGADRGALLGAEGEGAHRLPRQLDPTYYSPRRRRSSAASTRCSACATSPTRPTRRARATRSSRRSTSSRRAPTDRPRRHEVLRAVADDRRSEGRLESDRRRAEWQRRAGQPRHRVALGAAPDFIRIVAQRAAERSRSDSAPPVRSRGAPVAVGRGSPRVPARGAPRRHARRPLRPRRRRRDPVGALPCPVPRRPIAALEARRRRSSGRSACRASSSPRSSAACSRFWRRVPGRLSATRSPTRTCWRSGRGRPGATLVLAYGGAGARQLLPVAAFAGASVAVVLAYTLGVLWSAPDGSWLNVTSVSSSARQSCGWNSTRRAARRRRRPW